MIARFRTATKAAVLLLSSFPQLAVAQTSEIAERRIATMDLPAAERVTIICEGREASKLCQKLVSEPDYRDLWLEAGDKLIRAEWALAKIAVDAQEQLDRDNEAIQKMIDRAPKLPDGRAIFRAEDGRYFDVDGKLVPPKEAAKAR